MQITVVWRYILHHVLTYQMMFIAILFQFPESIIQSSNVCSRLNLVQLEVVVYIELNKVITKLESKAHSCRTSVETRVINQDKRSSDSVRNCLFGLGCLASVTKTRNSFLLTE